MFGSLMFLLIGVLLTEYFVPYTVFPVIIPEDLRYTLIAYTIVLLSVVCAIVFNFLQKSTMDFTERISGFSSIVIASFFVADFTLFGSGRIKYSLLTQIEKIVGINYTLTVTGITIILTATLVSFAMWKFRKRVRNSCFSIAGVKNYFPYWLLRNKTLAEELTVDFRSNPDMYIQSKYMLPLIEAAGGELHQKLGNTYIFPDGSMLAVNDLSEDIDSGLLHTFAFA